MIVKEREKLKLLLKLEALIERLLPNDPLINVIQLEIRRRKRQVTGEKEVEFPLSFINEKEYFVFHDLRLEDNVGFFQIDTLIMCKKFMLILEIKNWYGTIIFMNNGQVIRIGDDGKEEGFPSPVPQAKLQQIRLQNWLRYNGFKRIPIEFFIIISLPSTIIKSDPPNSIPNQVMYNNELLHKIHSLENQFISNIYQKKELKAVANKLISSHHPSDINILDRFNLSRTAIKKGVKCPKCSFIPMVRNKSKWYCEQCEHYSKDAHLKTLSDYKLLIDDRITNSQARDFLQINSPYVTKRLLQMGGFASKGNTSDRVYYL